MLEERLTKETAPAESKKDQLVDLHPREIIQINATVIAGALILMTIGSVAGQENKYLPYSLTILTIAVIIPFSFSSILAFHEHRLIESKKMMRAGFWVLLVVLLGLAAILFPGWAGLAKMVTGG